jgi:predicted nucleic acid-binding protein
MIVYVETNFILELALEQEQHQVANEILELVESGKIELAFPGFSISESLSKVTRQRIERDKFYNSLIELRRELKRSALYQQPVIDLDPVQALLTRSH